MTTPTTPTPEIDPDATIIPDKAQAWVILASEVADDAAAAALIPTTPDADMEALGWGRTGLLSADKGIKLTPSSEVREYDGFGYPAFRTKVRNGKLKSGFVVHELENETNKKIVLPGSKPGNIGIPKDLQAYVAYRYVDGDRIRIWVSLRPAALQTNDHSGFGDGKLAEADVIVHHTADAAGDVFTVVDDSTVAAQSWTTPKTTTHTAAS